MASPMSSNGSSTTPPHLHPHQQYAGVVGVCRFFLNGKLVTVKDADPLAPLVNTIRERCHAKATKVGCNQGNCGACTVTIAWPEGDPRYTKAPMCVNACLFPTGGLFVDEHVEPSNVCAKITTVEGALKNDRMASAAKTIAECNGTQCGFCTAGMVMKAAYYEGEVQAGLTNCTVRDVEDLLEGNLCRCTGFRPILYAMKKHFIGDEDEKVAQEIIDTPALVTQGQNSTSYLKCYATGDYSSPNVFVPKVAAGHHHDTALGGDALVDQRRCLPRDQTKGNAFLMQNHGKPIVKRETDFTALLGPSDTTSERGYSQSRQHLDDRMSLPADSPALPLSPANVGTSVRHGSTRTPIDDRSVPTPPVLPASHASMSDLLALPSPQGQNSGALPPTPQSQHNGALPPTDANGQRLPAPRPRLTRNNLPASTTGARHWDPSALMTDTAQGPSASFRRPRALSVVSETSVGYTPAAGDEIFASLRSPSVNPAMNATVTSMMDLHHEPDELGESDEQDMGMQLPLPLRTGQSISAPTGRGGQWFAPNTLASLIAILKTLHSRGLPYQLVAGNCSSAWSRLYEESPNANFVSVANMTELHQRIAPIAGGARLRVYAASTLNEWLLHLKHMAKRVVHDETLDLVTQHSFATANIQVRSLGTIAGNIIYANTRKGILHSDISLMFAALDGQMCYTTDGVDEHYISVAEFQQTVNPIRGVWVCKHFDVITPTSQYVTVRIARTGDRNENFPTSCSAVYSCPVDNNAAAKIFFTGPHKLDDGSTMNPAPVLVEILTTLQGDDPIGNLRKVNAEMSSNPAIIPLAQSEKQLMVQMSARVLTVDNGASGVQMTSMLEERKIECQTKNAQYFYVDPIESPMTEPLVKQDAYLATTGKAVYPFDVVDADTVNGSPVLSPVPILTFDPYDLQRKGKAFVQNIDPAADFFTAASMPYDPEVDQDVVATVPMPWIKPDVPGDEKRMFTGRNVLFGDYGYGGNYQYSVKETLKPNYGKDASNKYGPGGFGEFAIAPGFTVYAGQIIAFVVHPDETKSRGLAAQVMKELELLLAQEGTGRLNVILADHTATLGILDMQQSRRMGKAIVGPEVQSPSVFGQGRALFTDEAGKAEYEAWWQELKADPTNAYVELMPGDFVADADGWEAALEESRKAAEARARATNTPVQPHGPIVAAAQAHFYMETQVCLISASDEGRYKVVCSAQGPGDIQSCLTRVLNVPVRDITVVNNRIGGGYGGKTICAMAAAVGCGFLQQLTGRPTRVCYERRVDMQVVGKRHMEEGRYRVAVRADPSQEDFGKIVGLDLWYDGDAGCGTFISPTILQFSGLIGEGMYGIPNFRIEGNVFLTHKQSSTAMRAFGGIQATTITESAVDHAYAELVRRVGESVVMSANEFRAINFFRKAGGIVPHTMWRSWISWAEGHQPQFVHYHQPLLETDIMTGDGTNPGVWKTTIESAEYKQALAAVEDFNRNNKFRKRGIAVIPVKYAGGWDPKDKFFGRGSRFMIQNNVLVNIYKDGGNYPGYVLVNQSGVEMGQGIQVMIQQTAAAMLDVPFSIVRVAPMNTDTIPNQICTGASSGGDINMHAVREACTELRHRLEMMMDQIIYADVAKRIDNPAKYGLHVEQVETLKELLESYDPVKGFADVGSAAQPSRGWTTMQKSAIVFPITFTGVMPPKPRSPSSGRTTPTSPTPDKDPSLYYQAPLGSYHVNYYLAAFRSWKVPEPIKGHYDAWWMDYCITREMYLTSKDYLLTYGDLLQEWDPMSGFSNVRDLTSRAAWREIVNFMTLQQTTNPKYYNDLLVFAQRPTGPQRSLIDPANPPAPLTISTAIKFWASMVSEAFCNRVLLSAVGQGALNADGESEVNSQNWFCYFIYGSAWSVVEVDGVTGQTDVIRSDIYYDAGNSPNPAADVGQVEGAFVHGLGNIMTEQCDWNRKTGVLNQPSIMDVAIPDQRMIPRSLHTHLFWLDGPSTNTSDGNGNVIHDTRIDIKRRMQTPVFKAHRAKAASEASTCMSVVLMMAVRNAIAELRKELYKQPTIEFVPLSTPVIPQRVLEAIYGPTGNIAQQYC